MDWKKIKTILLISMILTNTVLAVYIYNVKNELSFSNDDYLDKVKSIYETNEIDFSDEVNLSFPKEVSAISAEYRDFDGDKLSMKISVNPLEKTEDGYYNEHESLVISDYILKYTNEKTPISEEKISQENAIAYAEEFISEWGLDVKYKFYAIANSGEKTQVIFKQIVGDYFINDGYMSFMFNGSSLEKFEYKWMDILDVNEEKLNELVGIDKILFDYLEYFQEGDLIENIELGYKFGANIDTEIVFGELYPYYIVKIRGKDAVLIRALE